MSSDVTMHNPNQPDAFGYQIAFVKAGAEGAEEASYSGTQYVSEINIFESLFAKSVCLTLGVFDGGGLMETIALQPGDFVDVMVMKDEDSKKLTKRFVILNISGVQRTTNAQAKTYVVSAMTMAAFMNKKTTVYRGFKGTHADMVKLICADFLAVDEKALELEATVGDHTLVAPGKAPFKLISQIMQHAISETGGETASLYFFYEDRDGHKFKTLNKIVTDAEVHDYMVSVDKNVDGEVDLSKIQHFQQLKAGSQSERMAAGMYENEVVEMDHMSRKITSTLWKFKEAGEALQVLGPQAAFDKAGNLEQWTNVADGIARGLSSMVKFRQNDEAFDGTNNYGKKFGSMVAQKAMFNQIIYAVQIFGNPGIKAGDVLNITSPAMAMQSDAPELDFSLQGKFLVGDVRHRIVNGENYTTILNIFKDGHETEYKPQEKK